MLQFSDICKYSNGYDFVWSGRITFPSELTGATFTDGWAIIPGTGTVNYDVTAKFITSTETIDWQEAGTVQAIDGYAIVPVSQTKRNKIVSRFLCDYSTVLNDQILMLCNTGWSSGISGAFWKLRIGEPSNYSVTNAVASDNCRDNPITVSWDVLAQTVYFIEILDESDTVIYTVTTNSSAKQTVIPAGTLDAGSYTIRLQAGYDLSQALNSSGAGVQTSITNLPITLWRIEPKIIAFEPDGVAQNREQPIDITWNSENQHSYVLKVKQGGVVVAEYSGTTGTAETIPANTLASGTTTLELTLKYVPTWGTEADAVYASDIINFEAYGTPPQPVLTTPETVDTAFPQITWTSSEQYTFRLKVLSGETVLQDTGEVPSELQFYTLTQPLDNGVYALSLVVKNQYGIYSPEATKTLTVSYVLPQKPIMYCAGNDDDGTISIKVFNADTGNFAHCDLFRKLDGDWVRIAKEQQANFEFIDYFVKPDAIYQYKARAIGSTSGYMDSDIKAAKASIVSTQLFELDKPDDQIDLRLEPSREETAHRSVHFMTYAGMQAPTVEFGEEQYSTVAVSFFVRFSDAERLKQLYNTASVLCYRDSRGRFLYGFISSDPVIRDGAYGWCAIGFDFTQTHYTEGV
jgi:hypothetical protein